MPPSHPYLLLSRSRQKSRAVAAERARFRAMCSLRERESAVRSEQARMMRLQRAMRGESAVSLSSPSQAVQAQDTGDRGDSVSETGSRFRAGATRAPPESDGGASIAASSVAGSTLLSSLGSAWATGAAIRLRNKVGARTGAASVVGSYASSKLPQRLGSAPASSASLRGLSSGMADEPGAPDRSLPRLRKVDTPSIAAGPALGPDAARDGLLRGAGVGRGGSVQQLPDRGGVRAASAVDLGPASPRTSPSLASLSGGWGAGRATPAAVAPPAATTSSRASAAANGLHAPRSVARSSAQPSLSHRSVGNDAGSVAAPASFAGSSFSESNPRDFVRHSECVARLSLDA